MTVLFQGIKFLHGMIYCLILLTITTSCGKSKPQAIHIVAFGDSTTAYRDTIAKVYTDRLPACMKERGIDVTVYNAGMRGSHTGRITDNDILSGPHALERFDEHVLQQNPRIVLIQYGINDAYIDGDDPEGPSRIPLQQFEQNLRFMITEIHKNNVIPVLMTPNQLGVPEPAWRNDRLSLYAKRMRQLAVSADLPLIDLWHALPRDKAGDYLLDGVHPNDAGHQQVADTIAESLAALLAPDSK